eukprot:1228620-Pleurochrysis_carterae.AAC.4
MPCSSLPSELFASRRSHRFRSASRTRRTSTRVTSHPQPLRALPCVIARERRECEALLVHAVRVPLNQPERSAPQPSIGARAQRRVHGAAVGRVLGGHAFKHGHRRAEAPAAAQRVHRCRVPDDAALETLCAHALQVAHDGARGCTCRPLGTAARAESGVEAHVGWRDV